MNRRTLTTWLSALLLLLAGLANTSHGAPDMSAEPCHTMEERSDSAHHGHHDRTSLQHTDQPAPPSDDSQHECQCCPGSCSSASALTAAQALVGTRGNRAFLTYIPRTPTTTHFELLRPPTAT